MLMMWVSSGERGRRKGGVEPGGWAGSALHWMRELKMGEEEERMNVGVLSWEGCIETRRKGMDTRG